MMNFNKERLFYLFNKLIPIKDPQDIWLSVKSYSSPSSLWTGIAISATSREQAKDAFLTWLYEVRNTEDSNVSLERADFFGHNDHKLPSRKEFDTKWEIKDYSDSQEELGRVEIDDCPNSLDKVGDDYVMFFIKREIKWYSSLKKAGVYSLENSGAIDIDFEISDTLSSEVAAYQWIKDMKEQILKNGYGGTF